MVVRTNRHSWFKACPITRLHHGVASLDWGTCIRLKLKSFSQIGGGNGGEGEGGGGENIPGDGK